MPTEEPLKIVGPLHNAYGEERYRFTVATIRETEIGLRTKVLFCKRPTASRRRNRTVLRGVRIGSWSEFRLVIQELGVRMGLDVTPLGREDITDLKGELRLRRPR